MAQQNIIRQDLKVALGSPGWGSWGGRMKDVMSGWNPLEKDDQDGQELWNERLVVSFFFILVTDWE